MMFNGSRIGRHALAVAGAAVMAVAVVTTAHAAVYPDPAPSPATPGCTTPRS